MSFSDAYRAIRYRAHDPLRYVHVPRRERLESDPPRDPDLDVWDDPDADLEPSFTSAIVPEAELT